jgi:hypothetical protein
MKKFSVSVLALMVLLAIPASTVYAQSEGTSFKVPFAFVVANKELPAGEYFVRSLYWNAVAIQPSQSKEGLITIARQCAMPADAQPKLIFHRYGKRYFLAEARLPNMDSGRKFYVTREELEIASQLPQPEDIEVAAK